MKTTTSFVCQECGYDSPKFLGKCPECGEWNTLKEIKIADIKPQNPTLQKREIEIKARPLSEIKIHETQRMRTGFSEVDGVLGGGIVRGSAILLAGDPGIGKSTLLLQIAFNIGKNSKSPVLYVSGEESEEQIKLRSQRLKDGHKSNILLLSQTNTDAILQVIADTNPSLVIVDSIQTMESENLPGLSGSVGQVRYAALQLARAAKELNVPVILVGHVTKEGTIAGPMILSHMVDVLCFLEGEKTTGTRVLRSFKNRFGPVDEVGIFAMDGAGMLEIKNPEAIFTTEKKDKNAVGSCLIVTLEGTRAFLVEIQALAVFTKFEYPKRVAIGIDYKRLELLLAVLQKHARLPVDRTDIFVNVAGGLKVYDTASDLGICLAIYSSLKNIPLGKTLAISEVGLLGELRSVPSLEKRIKQAKKLGFPNVMSSSNFRTINDALRRFE